MGESGNGQRIDCVALITGCLGFSGRVLVRLLQLEAQSLTGLDRALKPPDLGIDVRSVDIRCREEVMQTVQQAQPRHVVHLAAALAEDDVHLLADVNLLGTLNLLDAVQEHTPAARVCVVGSSAEYGMTAQSDCPIREDQPLRPLSLYGITKAMQGLAAQRAWLKDGLATVRVRTFNLIGPGQPDSLAPGAFARQIAEAEAGLRPPVITTGPLTDYRDFVDVRDAVRAYWLLAQHGQAGLVYNVCSGRAVQMAHVLKLLRSFATCELDVETSGKISPSSVPYQCGSYELLQQHTGWQPQIDLEQSVQDLLNYWRQVVRARAVS